MNIFPRNKPVQNNVNSNVLLFFLHRNMLEKLTRLLKLKQKLTLDPSANDFFEMDRFSVSRLEVTGRQSCILQVIILLLPVST